MEAILPGRAALPRVKALLHAEALASWTVMPDHTVDGEVLGD